MCIFIYFVVSRYTFISVDPILNFIGNSTTGMEVTMGMKPELSLEAGSGHLTLA